MSGTRFKREDAEAIDDCLETVGATQELEIPDEQRELDTDEFSEAERLELRVHGDLKLSGIVGVEATRLSKSIVARLLREGPDGYEDIVAGVQMVHHARSDLASELADAYREQRQLARLVDGFTSELGKLDETLEVLSTYVRRMRTRGDGKQTLH